MTLPNPGDPDTPSVRRTQTTQTAQTSRTAQTTRSTQSAPNGAADDAITATAAAHARSRSAFFAGVRDTIGIVPSYLPFGMVCGVASVNAGLTKGAAIALPALVYAGSAQAVLLQFLQNSAALWVAILSGCVINLRMAVYSAALAPKVRHFSTPKRMLIAAFLVDNSFALLQKREHENPTDKHLIAYYAGLTAVLWPFWIFFCVVGIFAGNVVPASWQLEFAIPLSFIAILSTSVRGLPMVGAAVAGGIASVALFSLPLKLGLVAACAVGLLGGLVVEKGVSLWTARKAG